MGGPHLFSQGKKGKGPALPLLPPPRWWGISMFALHKNDVTLMIGVLAAVSIRMLSSPSRTRRASSRVAADCTAGTDARIVPQVCLQLDS